MAQMYPMPPAPSVVPVFPVPLVPPVSPLTAIHREMEFSAADEASGMIISLLAKKTRVVEWRPIHSPTYGEDRCLQELAPAHVIVVVVQLDDGAGDACLAERSLWRYKKT